MGAALALHSFEIVQRKLLSIVSTKFGCGNLVLLGGVQINMPEGHEDHFLPLHFEMFAEGKDPVDLLDCFDFSDIMEAWGHWMATHSECASSLGGFTPADSG